MKIATTRFGEIEIDERDIIYMPEGLVGFGQHKQYIILEHDTESPSPFKWLQSVDDPDLAFIIVDPYLFKSDYRIEISPHEVAILQARDPEALICAVVVSIHRELPHPITANLQAPILINPENRWGRQCILTRGGYPVRYDLMEETRKAGETSSPPPSPDRPKNALSPQE
ncbi:MAG: flagellar assembly protein FliW [Candidatus Tectomicrobia bacterium]|uniref:Flagellar assembly factor FliW n=1 Tax=Tectimicrobiota bacterium TaxID=2528274 RepID=A0A932CLV5_UNCTE|nr:flagellar assembly protein FliW [Candidatus Tectomicrobia bacterium]